ncbi:hypothetical protein GJ633_11525 [Halorubrum sp. CBA1125]|uniref:DUF7522 family protein n=1 Tax=Halorubrum sp. CBA1125 TaxID=2668072 RepID=UPI0012E7437C|nr:hypothetical protein [Halorubrum sp. CBA1125]MUW15209.1 hypothetical protein [Halorubrum sp. CBA1125]
MPRPADDQIEELLTAARTATGDELRSLTYFTEDDVEQLYLRSDLSRTADLVGFAENERHGFHSQSMYANTQLGDYQFTVRVFENGYLTRVIANGHGVWVTTDSIQIDRFEELASALAVILRSFDPVTPGSPESE